MCYDKEVCWLWGQKTEGREGCVWGEYCVNKGNKEKKGGEKRSEADGGSCSCFAGRYRVKRNYFS